MTFDYVVFTIKFAYFCANVNVFYYSIMEKLESHKRQMAVNHELFETEEACNKFKVEKERQTLAQKANRADLDIWMYDPKSKTRAFSLANK